MTENRKRPFYSVQYDDPMYWDNRYSQETSPYDWYQRYSSLRPFVHKFLPLLSERILMVGCGTSVMSEEMVNDGYEDIMNVDSSSVVIDLMKRRNESIPQLKYMELNVTDMSNFPDETFYGVIDKGMLDSLMCASNASLYAAKMMGEVIRVLIPGGIYMLISYGEPSVRMLHLMTPALDWKIELYTISRSDCQKPSTSTPPTSSSTQSEMEPIPLTKDGLIDPSYVLEDPGSHFIYICRKTEPNN